ncbi:MAG: hypothetical protein ACT452_18055 [Microthrixaceae bacterium]
MRRTITYVAVWFAAGIGAVTLGSAAVSLVGNQVTGSRPAPLSADEVRSELSGDAGSTTTTTSDGSTTSTAPPGGTTVTTRPGPTPTTPAPSGTNGATPTTTASDSVPPPESRTYSLVGGTVTLRFEPSGVTVQGPTPRPGYSVDVEPTHDNGWRVRFRSADHESSVEGWWDDGPRDEVREEED